MMEHGPSGSNGSASESRPRVGHLSENLVYYEVSTRYSSEDSITPVPTFIVQPRSRPPPMIKCTICLDSIPESSKRVSTARCTHDCVLCADCLERHIVFSIRERGVTDVVCPTSYCAAVLAYDEIYAAVKDQSALKR